MKIQVKKENQFFSIPSIAGYLLTGFFQRRPLSDEFDLSETQALTGYLSFCYAYQHRVARGVLFQSIKSKSIIKEHLLTVGVGVDDEFEPQFLLEKMGLLIFSTSTSSVMLIPSEVESSLLVRVDQ